MSVSARVRLPIGRALAVIVCLGSNLWAPSTGWAQRALNRSTPTSCAEEDNVNVSFLGRAESFIIEATPPSQPAVNDCAADFTSCRPAVDPSYEFTPARYKLFDNGDLLFEAVREQFWWRPTGMSAAANAGSAVTDIHYIAVSKRIPGLDEWPQVLVLYADGNLRLIPHPDEGQTFRCFGSSVIVGPAAAAQRPLAEIQSIGFNAATASLSVEYAGGGSAVLRLDTVNRSIARVHVTVNYPADVLPFATFRSMFVADGNSDVDHARWHDAVGTVVNDPIMTLPSAGGREWTFFRMTPSKHNTSAPDIRIVADFGLTLRRGGSGTGVVTSSPSGINCGTTCGTKFRSGTGVTLTAVSAPESTFVSWTGDPECATGTFVLDDSRTCFANFVAAARRFTDDPLLAGTQVAAVHILELRQRINEVRTRYGLAAPMYRRLDVDRRILAADITELRNALSAAYAAAKVQFPSLTDNSLQPGTTVKVEHIAELRAAVVRLE